MLVQRQSARPVHCIILSYISLSRGFTMHFSPRPRFSLFVSRYLLPGMALKFWCEVRKLHVMLAVCNIACIADELAICNMNLDVCSKLLPII